MSASGAYQRLRGGKRLQVFGFGQFGDQILWIDVDLRTDGGRLGFVVSEDRFRCVSVNYPHLPLAGTQVQVQAALKTLVDEATVGGNLAQTGELPG